MENTTTLGNSITDSNIKKLLLYLLILFVLSNLMVQAFVTVSPLIADQFKINASTASIQATLTTITLGLCSVIYGALSDYIPVKKLLVCAISILCLGSIIGFVMQGNYIFIVLSRVIQTTGQAAISSLYLVIASRYLKGASKIKYFAYFTACFQIAQAAGVMVGGIITTYIAWQILLLIPFISILFIPIVLKYAPKEEKREKKKIDILGLAIFSCLVICITLFVDGFQLLYLCGILCSTVLFLLYIKYHKDAFITPKFFHENKTYIRALSIVIMVYVTQFSFSFICTFIVTKGYQESLSIVSFILLPAYIAAAVVGGIGDKITKHFGEFKTISMGIASVISGLLIAMLFIDKGFLVLSLAGILFFVGFNTLYSPLLHTVTATLPQHELGRGIGLNDLAINISGSLGVALCGKLMTLTALQSNPIVSQSSLAIYQNILCFLTVIAIVALLWFQSSKKHLAS